MGKFFTRIYCCPIIHSNTLCIYLGFILGLTKIERYRFSLRCVHDLVLMVNFRGRKYSLQLKGLIFHKYRRYLWFLMVPFAWKKSLTGSAEATVTEARFQTSRGVEAGLTSSHTVDRLPSLSIS